MQITTCDCQIANPIRFYTIKMAEWNKRERNQFVQEMYKKPLRLRLIVVKNKAQKCI